MTVFIYRALLLGKSSQDVESILNVMNVPKFQNA